MSLRVHLVDSDGNLEWVERIIDAKRPHFLKGEKFHMTEQQFREALRLAYRNGASEHEQVIRAAIDSTAKLFPREEP